jgi:FkbM family methyltransferase
MPINNLKKILYFLKKFLLIKILNEIIEPEQIILKKIKFKTVIDIGSHLGFFTQSFLSNSKKVISIDPLSYLINFQKIIFYFNKHIKFLNYAIGLKDENKNIFIPFNKNFYNDSRSSLVIKEKKSKKVKIKVKNGDKLLKKYDVDFIKIDAEGYELQIIKSLKNLIHKKKPSLLIEIVANNLIDTAHQEIINEKNNNNLEIFRYLNNYGYEIFYCDKINKLKKISLNNIKKKFREKTYNFKFKKNSKDIKKYKKLRNKKYIIMFFFIPKFPKHNSQIELKKFTSKY